MFIQYYQELLNECIDISEHIKTGNNLKVIFENVKKGNNKWKYY